jgi:cyclic pyranopterin phosphate synthase
MSNENLMELSHIDKTGAAAMVDVSPKQTVKRTAVACGSISLGAETIRLLKEGLLKKGDALACARIAGICAAKKTSDLIPLCHNLPLDNVSVDFSIGEKRVDITARSVCTGRTGIEMEALTAVSVAALTIYDMCKAVDKNMVIGGIRLVEKKKEPVA